MTTTDPPAATTDDLVTRAQQHAARIREQNRQAQQERDRRSRQQTLDATNAPTNGQIYAEAKAGLDWTEQAIDIIHQIATQLPYFTIDDIRPHLPATEGSTAHGQLMRQAAARGYIKLAKPPNPNQWPPGAHIHVQSETKSNTRPLWQSLLNRP